jgi:hypothetical protein
LTHLPSDSKNQLGIHVAGIMMLKMRSHTTKERIESLMRSLGTSVTSEGCIYFTGGVSAVLMHMQGEPKTMQANPHYDDAPREKPVVVDTCIAWSSKGDWVRERFPDFYTGDAKDAPGPAGVA